MKRPGFEFIFGVADNRRLIAEKNDAVGTFANVGMPFKRESLLFRQFSQPFDELVTFHGGDDRTKISECQEGRVDWCAQVPVQTIPTA